MKSFRQKTIDGLIWSFIDSFAGQGIQFIVGIILARLLSPYEFGLIGMVIIFIAVSQTFVDSGFSNALIRKQNCTSEDYSTVFYFNFVIGLLFYLILFFSAPFISLYFAEPSLIPVIKVLGCVLLIDSLMITQRTILMKQINFKLQARISVLASLTSGGLAIYLAYKGLGVWSLVVMQISSKMVNLIMLWIYNLWYPMLVFRYSIFKELFGFGSKLLLSGIIETIYRNIYLLVIGKYFSAIELGYYTRANQFKDLPSQNLTQIILRVTYPVLSEIQNDPENLRAAYIKMAKIIMYISILLMAGLASMAEPLVISLIGEKWRASIIYLQMLAFVGVWYPILALNLNILNVFGRSDIFLKLVIINKFLAVPAIIIGILFGIKIMISLMILNSLISYYLNSYYTSRCIGYSIRKQLRDIAPTFLLSLVMAAVILFIGWALPAGFVVKLIVQIITSTIIVITISKLFKFSAYLELKQIVISKIQSLHGRK